METEARDDIKYSPIRLSSLRGNLKIPFDVYVKVSDKYILYCRAQEAIEGERLNRLLQKKLSHVYINSTDLIAYTKYTQLRISEAYDRSKGLPLKERCGVILGALQTATEEMISDLGDATKLSVAQEGARRLGKFLQEEPKALKVLLSFDNEQQNLAHHGVKVAALAYVLSDHLGYRESKALKIPAFLCACLIHDLEHHYTSMNLTVQTEELSEAESKIYKRHAQSGAERLLGFDFYDPLIIDVIQFHEGKTAAAPLTQKKHRDLDPLVFIAAASNMYDQLVSRQKLSPREALRKMLIDGMGSLPLECLKGLQEVLKSRIFD